LKPKADSVNAKVFNMPVIHCRCGAEILLIPDAAATGEAIERHVQNCDLTKLSKNRKECIEALSMHLIGQVIDAAAETEPEEKHSVKTHPA
jgi:hypothetical protein